MELLLLPHKIHLSYLRLLFVLQILLLPLLLFLLEVPILHGIYDGQNILEQEVKPVNRKRL